MRHSIVLAAVTMLLTALVPVTRGWADTPPGEGHGVDRIRPEPMDWDLAERNQIALPAVLDEALTHDCLPYDAVDLQQQKARILDFERRAAEAANRGLPLPSFTELKAPTASESLQTAPTITIAGAPSGGETLAPPAYRSFAGPVDPVSCPADPTLATGPAHIGAMVNSQIQFHRKDGSIVRGPVSFAAWWPGAGTPTLFDPKIIYDVHNNRWVMLILAGNQNDPNATYYCLSISRTSNPEGGWWNYYLRSDIDGSTDSDYWADRPHLGFDHGDATDRPESGGAIYITTNQFSGNTFKYAKLRILYKHELYSGSNEIHHYDFWARTNGFGRAKVFTWSPARTHAYTGPSWHSPEEYLLNTLPGGGSYVTLYWVSSPIDDPPTLHGPYRLSVTAYAVPPDAVQGGGAMRLASGDCRSQDVSLVSAPFDPYYTIQAKYLYMAFNDRWDFGTPGNVESILRILRVRANGQYSQADWDEWFGSDNFYYFRPSIDANKDRGATTVFTFSGQNTFAGIGVTGRRHGADHSENSRTVTAGQAYYNPGGCNGTGPLPVKRWGDYSGVASDCAGDGDGLWTIGAYAGVGNQWMTTVEGSSYGAPNVGHILDGASAEGVVRENDRTRYYTWEIRDGSWSGVVHHDTGAGHSGLSATEECGAKAYAVSSTGNPLFIVANGARTGATYHIAQVTRGDENVPTPYRLEAWTIPITLTVPSLLNRTMPAARGWHLFQADLVSGRSYRIKVDITNGNADLGLWVFKGSRRNGNRNNVDASSNRDVAGAEGDEEVVLRASETSKYCFALTNENRGASDYQFILEEIPPLAQPGTELSPELSMAEPFRAYPVPASTEISFVGVRDVEIFDPSGRRVASLSGAGQRIAWDVRDQPAGVYFARPVGRREAAQALLVLHGN